MAFGFLIERFGLFLQIAGKAELELFQRHMSFFLGEAFVLLSVFLVLYSTWQYKRVLRTLQPEEIPAGYGLSSGVVLNSIVGVLGVFLSIYLGWSFL